MTNGVVAPGMYPKTIRKLHTKVIQETVSYYTLNRVLGSRPPRISPSQKTLPRQTRVTMSQLRSGHCARLADYQFRIGKVDSDTCPECQIHPASVKHIFECPSNPTRLTTRDLFDESLRGGDLSYEHKLFQPPSGGFHFSSFATTRTDLCWVPKQPPHS